MGCPVDLKSSLIAWKPWKKDIKKYISTVISHTDYSTQTVQSITYYSPRTFNTVPLNIRKFKKIVTFK